MTFAARVRGVLLLDARTFEDIEADRSANGQAVAVVIVASLVAGVGAGIQLGPSGLIRETIGALAGWVMWAGVTWLIGAKLLPEPQTRTDMGELLRVIGYSYAPNAFAALSSLPAVGRFIGSVVAFWLLAATVIAVRQALDYTSTLRATIVVVAGWLVFVAIQWVS
jgi:hypothetical protein